ncbi:DUF2087 domain-containing protein [Streptacidiphilus sp. PB12-B1b]|uniref:DUF2087 domain-containing protein n=1 Tax=Streptacidiphilus sp. PB12-B1b TaxID=2705012 RepID=UPI0015F9E54D|nr:DUF2087 domain-containing protein [Streptacidiphilus sp. PB12-B1b]QMU77533.1 DUF2087 domain-containing protein [Streptacidiphilus sp. PB12-B1b]
MSPRLTAVAPLASALADPERLRLFSRLVLAGPDGLDPAELRAEGAAAVRQVQRLAQAGLADLGPDGRATARPDAFATALGSADRQPGDEVAQLFRDGRLTAVPVRPALRRALLEHLAERVFEPGTGYTEPEVNIALRQYWDDFPALRRYLVEGGLLERSADGRRYRLAARPGTGTGSSADTASGSATVGGPVTPAA